MLEAGELYRVVHGDCLEVLRGMPAGCVDAVVTDPPYGLAFMGKAWDHAVPGPEVWAECLRVLKPGGHLVAFFGTRTYHRGACAVEDAGFEVRDQLAWCYGSGFPKSLAVDKAIDRQRHERAEVLEVTAWVRKARDAAGLGNAEIDAAFGFNGMAGHWCSAESQPSVPTLGQVPRLLEVLKVPGGLEGVPERIRTLLWTLNGNKGQPGAAWFARGAVGAAYRVPNAEVCRPGFVEIGGVQRRPGDQATSGDKARMYQPTAPASDEARRWKGWGTALKPAWEPVVLARKPLGGGRGTVADCVREHGTGALNIDGCRVEVDPADPVHGAVWTCRPSQMRGGTTGWITSNKDGDRIAATAGQLGRWPANLVHDGSAEVVGMFPGEGTEGQGDRGTGWPSAQCPVPGASRFFYTAKADRDDRDDGLEGLGVRSGAERAERAEGSAGLATAYAGTRGPARNHHPTVKPTDLMRWLCRLVTPPGGVVLDPYTGSGSTGRGALLEGMRFVGIEREPEYVDLARRRIEGARARFALFGGCVPQPREGNERRATSDEGSPGLFS